jgi:hypothetical protein
MAPALCSLYVVCHDDESHRKAVILQAQEPSVRRILRVAPSPFFESSAFNQLAELEGEWCQSQFVGILPYSFRAKSPPWIEQWTVSELVTQRRDDVDVIGLLSFTSGDMLTHALKWHGAQFCRAWKNLIETTLGASAAAYACTAHLPLFFSNAWVARQGAFREYLHYALRCMQAIESCGSLQSALNQDALYKGGLSRDQLQAIFGKPHYCLHPFVFERLPCFFFMFRGWRVWSSLEMHRPSKSLPPLPPLPPLTPFLPGLGFTQGHQERGQQQCAKDGSADVAQQEH